MSYVLERLFLPCRCKIISHLYGKGTTPLASVVGMCKELCLLVLEQKGKGLLVALVGAFGFVVFIGWLGFFFFFLRRGEALKPCLEHSFNLRDK